MVSYRIESVLYNLVAYCTMFLKVWLRSLRHAAQGIAFVLRNERNFQIECFVSILVVFFATLLPLSLLEWSVLLFMIGWVLVLEMVNTAIERLLDIVKPNVHPYVRVVKDMAAGAVLIASFIAILVGVLILLPHIIAY